jgi:Arc/MetJ-type ribon-helix-helix transcriptional regulator
VKIITVNLPISYLRMIDHLVGETALYPSRSELIRVAVREFLIRELEAMKSFQTFRSPQAAPAAVPMSPTPEQDLFVQVPYGTTADGSPEFRTFRIVKK